MKVCEKARHCYHTRDLTTQQKMSSLLHAEDMSSQVVNVAQLWRQAFLHPEAISLCLL